MSVYACGDLHGYIEIYNKIKKILKPEDKIIFVGDAGDRGPQSWECIKAIYNDPQFIYLKGNHEDILVDACNDYLAYEGRMTQNYYLCVRNGGSKTIDDWKNESEKEKWVNHLKNLPTIFSYSSNGRTFILSHAGFTPWLDENNLTYKLPEEQELLWNREHYFEDWNEKEMQDVIIVHGHTPNHHLAMDLRQDWESGAFWYSNNHKVCIDSGGFFSGKWTMLNLDTLEEIIITLDERKEYEENENN